MKSNKSLGLGARSLAWASIAASAAASSAASAWPTPAPAAGGGWNSAGNHRFRIDAAAGTAPGATVRADVPWRRRDTYYGVADTFVVSGAADATAPLVARCFRNDSSLTASSAEFTFAADAGAGPYFLYFLPFSTCEYAGGACQYSADVSYARRAHCADAPWWPAGAAPAAAAAVTYEAVTDFDAFTDMEAPMSPDEFAAFLAGASRVAPPPLGALLVAEGPLNSARLWGANYGAAAPAPAAGAAAAAAPPPQPFCDYCAPCGAWYLKTGGVPSKTSGWDHGDQDRCCSTDATDCVWFPSEAACQAFDPDSCRACAAGEDDLGCPSWSSGGGGGGGGSVPLPAKYLGVAPDALARLSATLAPNSNFSFQALVVTPANATVAVLSVAPQPPAVPGVRFECFSTQGVDYWGRDFSPPVAVSGLLPLWLGAFVDRAAPAGAYNVTFLVELAGADGGNASLPLTLELTVTADAPLPDGSDSLPRVHWLNSRLGNDDTSVPRPFTPISSNASTLPAAFAMHGKIVEVGASGLPAAVTTFGASASPPIDALGGTSVLAPQGVSCAVSLNGGANLSFSSWATTAFAGNGSAYEWAAESRDTTGAVTLAVAGSVDATGYVSLAVSLAPGAALAPSDTLAFFLTVPAAPANAIYGMGLGRHGGRLATLFPSPSAPFIDWRWDGVNGNNGVWVGSTTGGALLKLKGDDPLWQASVPYDSNAAPPAPPNWSNAGAGGLRLSREGVAEGFSGAFAVGAGANATRTFRASLLVSPVHNLNLTHHYSLRYAQLEGPANYTFLAEHGASVVNMHQGNVVNPFINYPYMTNDVMRETASAIQSLGMRFGVYNTMRELSNRCAETFAMRAMGDAYVPGGVAGPGADWLKEHVATDFLAAWSTPVLNSGNGFVLDAAMRVVALSRCR